MLIDTAKITVRGGHGGAGMSKKHKGPDGGNGGKGGDVYIKSSSNINLLNQFSQKDVFVAGNGGIGGRNNKTGRQGDDIEILLPIGTSIYESIQENRERKISDELIHSTCSGSILSRVEVLNADMSSSRKEGSPNSRVLEGCHEKKSGELILEVNKIDERILICNGGSGGWGGLVAEKGIRGEEKKLILSLRLIAYFGLIGLPNVGKSSLLNEITNAHANVANYPFTTLEPNLGVFEGKCLADIPGLIEGASVGKGLGIAFLKHIEKVEILLHCISCETQNALKDYKTVRNELSEFNLDLTRKPEVIILTKTDLADPSYVMKLIKELNKLNKKIIPVSIHNFQSLEELKKVIRNI